MKDFLINQKHLDVLNHINKNKDDFFHNIHKDVNVTYSHLVKKIKSELILYNLMTIEKKGRKKVLNLTEKGKEATEYANKIKKILEVKC